MLGGWSLKEYEEKEFNPRRVMMLCVGSKSQNTDYVCTSRKSGHPIRKRLWRVVSSGRGQHKYQDSNVRPFTSQMSRLSQLVFCTRSGSQMQDLECAEKAFST